MRQLFPEPSDLEDTLEGVLERITFASEDGGFCVVRLQVPGDLDLVTAVGAMPGVRIGESLRMTGKWVDDRRYGRQFKVASFVPVLPSTELGIERYLASGVIKGVGKVTAAKIVQYFGAKALDILSKEPERLRVIPGLKAKADAIGRAWAEQRAVNEIMVFLQSLGMGTALAAKIWKFYGRGATEVVKNDPYRLAAEITGVGFLTADRIAAGLGIPPSSPERAQAGVMHVLRDAAADGHCYVPMEELGNLVAQLLGEEGAPASEAVAALSTRALVAVEDDAVYARALFDDETAAAARLRALLDAPPVDVPIEAERAVDWFGRQEQVELCAGQRDAATAAIRGKITVITGGPGTGKTTLVRGLTAIFEAKKLRLALCAPTGRAARRLAEASGATAKTVHRLLEFNPGTGAFQRHPGRLLEADVVIADEASMLDIHLFRILLDAIPSSARLILVGDADQLPSVGPGSVLRDVIGSKSVETVRLTEIFRQEATSLIVTNAHRVLHGEPPEPHGADFDFVERDDPEAALSAIVQAATRDLPARLGIAPLDVQVLVPMHKGTLGSIALNAALQQSLNSAAASAIPGRNFRVGDKVMQIRNNYDLDVFNGDLGTVESFDTDTGVLVARFDGKACPYDIADLDQLELAYACTIHKSQGSEYPAAVVALHTQHFPMLQRNLLYTAITRGKRHVTIVGSKRALRTAIANDRERLRWTRLAKRLECAAEGGGP